MVNGLEMIMLQLCDVTMRHQLSYVDVLQLAQPYLVDTRNRTGAKSVHNEYMRARDLSVR
jgi:hypothetical protein